MAAEVEQSNIQAAQPRATGRRKVTLSACVLLIGFVLASAVGRPPRGSAASGASGLDGQPTNTAEGSDRQPNDVDQEAGKEESKPQRLSTAGIAPNIRANLFPLLNSTNPAAADEAAAELTKPTPSTHSTLPRRTRVEPPALPREFQEAAQAPQQPALQPTIVPTASPPPRRPIVHIIHNGDTLEKLARRYLDDETRAIEIFRRNRAVLDNPHILPIGMELEIPLDDS